MTPDQQRIAIATACGWTDIRRQRLYAGDQDLWGNKLIGSDNCRNRLPDYLNDLNACHEMEQVLTEKQQRDFCFRLLLKLVDGSLTSDLNDHFIFLHATADQRAEAFLRTLDLWQETLTQSK